MECSQACAERMHRLPHATLRSRSTLDLRRLGASSVCGYVPNESALRLYASCACALPMTWYRWLARAHSVAGTLRRSSTICSRRCLQWSALRRSTARRQRCRCAGRVSGCAAGRRLAAAREIPARSYIYACEPTCIHHNSVQQSPYVPCRACLYLHMHMLTQSTRAARASR